RNLLRSPSAIERNRGDDHLESRLAADRVRRAGAWPGSAGRQRRPLVLHRLEFHPYIVAAAGASEPAPARPVSTSTTSRERSQSGGPAFAGLVALCESRRPECKCSLPDFTENPDSIGR